MVVNAPVLAEFAPIAVPSIEPEFMSMPVTGVVPSSRSSIESKFVLILVPHVSSEAPTSGLVKLYVVVVVFCHNPILIAVLTGASVHATISSSVASVHVSAHKVLHIFPFKPTTCC